MNSDKAADEKIANTKAVTVTCSSGFAISPASADTAPATSQKLTCASGALDATVTCAQSQADPNLSVAHRNTVADLGRSGGTLARGMTSVRPGGGENYPPPEQIGRNKGAGLFAIQLQSIRR